MKKILILTTQNSLINLYDNGELGSHTNWGMIELRNKYNTKIIPIGNRNIIKNSILVTREDFDVLYMHNTNPFRLAPIQILRFLFPSFKKKKIVSLCHASIFGKGHRPPKSLLLRRFISCLYKGYDRILFFSPLSCNESVNAGLNSEKCRLIHWGPDLEYIKGKVNAIARGNYWLSTGKELRDFDTIETASRKMKGDNKIKVVKGGMPYKNILQLTAKCMGILVIPLKQGLNYCTGLTCVMEAFAFGKPIISVRNPYFPFDLEKEGCGIYVNPESPNEIAAAIRTIESDCALYERMCQNSMRMAESYNMEIYKNELFEIIDEI